MIGLASDISKAGFFKPEERSFEDVRKRNEESKEFASMYSFYLDRKESLPERLIQVIAKRAKRIEVS